MSNLYSGFSTTSDTNQAVQPQKIAKGLIFVFRKYRDRTSYVAKTKALISCAVVASLFSPMQTSSPKGNDRSLNSQHVIKIFGIVLNSSK